MMGNCLSRRHGSEDPYRLSTKPTTKSKSDSSSIQSLSPEVKETHSATKSTNSATSSFESFSCEAKEAGLLEAAKTGDFNTIEKCLNSGCLTNCKDQQG